MHLLGKAEGELVVYGRLFMPHEGEDHVRIGRIVTAPAFRGEGFGDQLMHKLFDIIEEKVGSCRVVLSSQVSMQKFYEKYGFQAHGDTYLEAGTPHVRMVRMLAKAA
jgi:ElaA protein